MTLNDCERFTKLLTDLLAEPPVGSADPRLAALREHAARCPSCAASADLVTVASTPAERRDPIDDPGAAYWEAFDCRLSDRLGRPRRVVRLLGITAAAAVALTVVWVTISRRPEVPVAASDGSPAATPVSAEGLDDNGPADDDASVGFGAAEPLDAFADDDAGGLFPAVDQLSPAETQRLLRWLEDEEARVKRGDA